MVWQKFSLFIQVKTFSTKFFFSFFVFSFFCCVMFCFCLCLVHFFVLLVSLHVTGQLTFLDLWPKSNDSMLAQVSQLQLNFVELLHCILRCFCSFYSLFSFTINTKFQVFGWQVAGYQMLVDKRVNTILEWW